MAEDDSDFSKQKLSPEGQVDKKSEYISSESRSGQISHGHSLISSKYKSRRILADLEEQKKKNATFLSYTIPETMQEIRDAKNKKSLVQNFIAKQVLQEGLDLNKLSPDEIKEIATKMGLQNFKVDQQVLNDIRGRVLRIKNNVNYSNNPKRKL